MDMQYQYTEKYVKDIAEAVRFIVGSTDTYSIKEMPAAILSANPPVLDDPDVLFGTKFNAQLDTGDPNFRWGIYSEYPDKSYFVTMDAFRARGTYAVINRGIAWNYNFTRFEPMYTLIVNNNNTVYFTRAINNPSCGVYLDNKGWPHIPSDMPFIMPEYSNSRTSGFDGNQGIWWKCWQGSSGYNVDSSLYSYLTTPSALSDNPVFKNRFKAFGATNLNGKVPDELYSVLLDGDWHTGDELGGSFDINSLINPVTLPEGTTITNCHLYNMLNHRDGNLGYYYDQWWGGHGGPGLIYLKNDNDRWGFNTNTKEFFRTGGGNLKGYCYQYDINNTMSHTQNHPHEVYPIGDGIHKDTINSIFTTQDYDSINWQAWSAYSNPASVDELESYLPFRTYDIVDQNGNVLLTANATLADFGLS